MVISKTPYRVSFFGGGTDFSQHFLKHGGAVLSTTIDKYCYISCRVLPPFFTNKHRIVWSHIENVAARSEILHPAVREGLRYLGFDDSTGFEIHHQGDLPARSGMGSSSAFAVGFLKAMLALQGKIVSRHELALKAIELEQDYLHESVGCQDQVATAYGGFNLIQFLPNGEIRVDPVTLPQRRIQELQSNLLLFYTGSNRNGCELASKLISQIDHKEKTLYRMRSMVDESVNILSGNQGLASFGQLLAKAWTAKRELNRDVSNEHIEKIYQTAIEHGALGGKILGAGGAGFILFYVPEERQAGVKRALSNLLHVPFVFESEGSSLVHYVASNFASQDRDSNSGFKKSPLSLDK
jgi:D-glycero-alpha-D-manno-heptose-7-phosphate kinase